MCENKSNTKNDKRERHRYKKKEKKHEVTLFNSIQLNVRTWMIFYKSINY